MTRIIPSLLVLCLALACGSNGATDDAGMPDASADAAPDAAALPVDQCTNAADVAAFAALMTDAGTGGDAVAGLAADCPLGSCGGAVGAVVANSTELTRAALADCISQCIADASGISRGCTDCYGETGACAAGLCLTPCAADQGSDDCLNCVFENCTTRLSACTGL